MADFSGGSFCFSDRTEDVIKKIKKENPRVAKNYRQKRRKKVIAVIGGSAFFEASVFSSFFVALAPPKLHLQRCMEVRFATGKRGIRIGRNTVCRTVL